MKEQIGHFIAFARIKVRYEGTIWALNGMRRDKGKI